MRRGEQAGESTFGVRLTGLANAVIKITGTVIFTILIWYAFRYTQYMNPTGDERPINVHDSMKKNILFLLFAIAIVVGLFVLEKYLTQRIQRWVMTIAVTIAAAWIGICGMWWITAIDRQPVGDQAFIYGGASYFLEGQYSFLGASGYCGIYPHQLGLIFLMEILFVFVGTYNYFAFQVICVELAVGIVLLGYCLLREMTEHMAAAVSYCLIMLFCFPLVFYTGWVYGDVPSIFFALLAAVCLLHYDKSGRSIWLVGLAAAALMAMLVRKNSMIMLVALCLAGGVKVIEKRDKRLLAALIVSVLLPILAYQGIYKMYELRSGYPHSDGVPAISFVAMGMQENNGKYGWYNNYCKEVYYAQEFDSNLTKVVSGQDVRRRLEEFRGNKAYAYLFYREKILSQWNEPLYQSLYFSSQYIEDVKPEEGSFLDKLGTEYFLSLLGICDRVQFILYFGMLCYFLFAVKKDSNILQHLLAVTMIGGFLFSIIWEAKARYTFPYYITMYSLAAVGYWQAITFVRAMTGRKQKGEKEENILPFERVA